MGQRVYAIGNPFGLTGGPSVTSGVISAINRTIDSERGLIENLVQTDASINPGNSGGPLVDVMGKVIAINTAIIPFAQGIGFAIPINSAKTCTDEIITEGGVKKTMAWYSGINLNTGNRTLLQFTSQWRRISDQNCRGQPCRKSRHG